MAQRYGGKHSPGGAPEAAPRPASGASGWEGRRRSAAGGRINALFIAPFPLLPLAFAKEPVGLALNLVAFGILMGAAYLTKQGVLAQEAYAARSVAKRPAIPRKIFASVLTGLGLAVAGLGGDPVAPAIFAVLGAGLHFLAFGADPLRDKGAEGVDSFQADRVAAVVDEAEAHLREMHDAILRAKDREAVARVERFQLTARRMCRQVEEDPRDLTGARKYLGVYLLGAKDATVKFADLYSRSQDAKARQDYFALLKDLEQGFTQRMEKLLVEDRTDLDVEIEVLRDRLAQEGVRTRAAE
ncbi:5-bromo-4-chloroindolyl phosphate hydrolysis family protein [Oceaniglobus roseus]|uniref:5-bromo-4-chloroindolyl phosphate hydrolysis family protein n=1 Tax=Oceaniglobus roseus TaxID=1737570 RepID=UPI000C7EBA29|nr:5-bromo-4-chloroindolyl phosphate hydrolysis family protein [Kandeliimicrobium roseum]